MTIEIQKDLLKGGVCRAFNSQFGTTLLASDWDMAFKRTEPGVKISVLFTTKATSDEVRVLLNVRSLEDYDSYGTFELQTLLNLPSGDNRDEVFVTNAVLKKDNLNFVLNYLASPEFITFQNTKPRVLTQGGGVLMAVNGYPLQTQS